MDDAVLAALQRWPNVPAVAGWLSLDRRGEWRLHPNGDARPGQPGEGITNEQLLAFIGRNYAAEPDGRWYFQNGPQRVYVTLDAAPLVVRLAAEGHHLETHHGVSVSEVTTWYLGDDGQLYLQTPQGPAMVLDRDLAALLERLHTDDGQTLAQRLEALGEAGGDGVALPHGLALRLDDLGATRAPLLALKTAEAEAKLGFVREPQDS